MRVFLQEKQKEREKGRRRRKKKLKEKTNKEMVILEGIRSSSQFRISFKNHCCIGIDWSLEKGAIPKDKRNKSKKEKEKGRETKQHFSLPSWKQCDSSSHVTFPTPEFSLYGSFLFFCHFLFFCFLFCFFFYFGVVVIFFVFVFVFFYSLFFFWCFVLKEVVCEKEIASFLFVCLFLFWRGGILLHSSIFLSFFSVFFVVIVLQGRVL